jgi:proline iminopeptidase
MKRSLVTTLLALSPALSLFACQSTSGGAGKPEESYIEAADGKLLFYRKVGSGESVLLVPEGSWVMDDMARLARNHTVIFYDPRGRGLSDVSRSFRFEQDLGDLEAVVAWFELERFSMLGTHLGATLAAMYTAKHPERIERLVLVSPPPVRKEPYWKIYQRVFNDRRSEEAFKQLAVLKRDLVPRHDPARWAEAYKEAFFTGWVVNASVARTMKSTPFPPPNDDPESQVSKYMGMVRDLGDWDWRPLLEEIDCPTLIIYGSEDPVPQKSFAEWAAESGARVEVINKAGRLPWLEKPGAFYSEVEKFLDE